MLEILKLASLAGVLGGGGTGISSQKRHYYHYSDIGFLGNWWNINVGSEKNKIEF